MYLTKSDSATIAGLITLIEATLDGYNESPCDQIDTLRAKLVEVSDILTDESFDVGIEQVRNEALKDIEQDLFNELFKKV